jgi:pimeloyl-ACP methyl ester carboxylesterase
MDIYYESIGSGLPVIMIHGRGPDHRSLKGCMDPCFADDNDLFRRVYFDLPGFGKSKASEWLSNADRMLEFISDFIDWLIPDQAFLLVGNSYGGYLARGIAKQKQNLIRGLFLLCPSIRNKIPKPVKCVLEKDPILDEILSAEDKSYFEPVVVRQTIKVWNRFKEEILPGLKMADQAFIKEYWGRNAAYTFDADKLENPLEEPVLVLMGKQDSMSGYCDSMDIFKNYPRASFAILENAGHALQIEQPELFQHLTKEWLDRVIHAEENVAAARPI